MRETGWYKALSVPMMTQYRGIVWSDVKFLVLAIILTHYIPEMYPMLIMAALFNMAITVVAFSIDGAADYVTRERKVRNLPVTWNDVRGEHKSLRDIGVITSRLPHLPPKRNNNNKQERRERQAPPEPPRNQSQYDRGNMHDHSNVISDSDRRAAMLRGGGPAPISNTGETRRIEPSA